MGPGARTTCAGALVRFKAQANGVLAVAFGLIVTVHHEMKSDSYQRWIVRMVEDFAAVDAHCFHGSHGEPGSGVGTVQGRHPDPAPCLSVVLAICPPASGSRTATAPSAEHHDTMMDHRETISDTHHTSIRTLPNGQIPSPGRVSVLPRSGAPSGGCSAPLPDWCLCSQHAVSATYTRPGGAASASARNEAKNLGNAPPTASEWQAWPPD